MLVGCFALAVRVAFLLDFVTTPLFDANLASGTDMAFLVGWARRIAAGDLLGAATGPFWWAPLYPYTLGAMLAVLGGDALPSAALAQAVLGACTAALLYLLGRRLCDETVGLLAGLLAAAYGPAIFYTGVLLSTTLEVFLAVATLLAVTRARAEGGGRNWALAGGLAGLACLARPNFLLATAVLAALLPLSAAEGAARPAWRRGLRQAAGFALAVLLVIAPVTLRNWAVSGQLVLISAAGPETFRIGNSFDSTPLNFIYPQAPPMPITSSAFWRHQARKAVLFWWGFEAPQNVNYYLARELSPVLAWPWVPFWVAVPFAALGLYATRHRWRALLHVHAFLGAYYLSVVAFFVIARWRLPLIVPLLIFSAAGLKALGDWGRAGRRTGAALALGAVVLLAWRAFPGRGPFVFPADHAQLGYILANREEHGRAATHLAVAAAAFPGHGALHRDLGILLLRLRRPAEARGYLERAVALLPADASAHYQLGKLLASSIVDRDRGREHLQRALSLGPQPAVAAEIRALLAQSAAGPSAP